MKSLSYFKKKINEELAELEKITVRKDGKTVVYKSKSNKTVEDSEKETSSESEKKEN